MIGLPRRSRMVNATGEGNYRKIAHHLPVGLYRLVKRSLCLYRKVPANVRPNQSPTGFVSAHSLPANGSPTRAVQPSAGPALPVLLPYPDAS